MTKKINNCTNIRKVAFSCTGKGHFSTLDLTKNDRSKTG